MKTGAAVPAGETLWFLEAFRGLQYTEPTHMLFCRGGFMQVPDVDGDYLRRVPESLPAPKPVR